MIEKDVTFAFVLTDFQVWHVSTTFHKIINVFRHHRTKCFVDLQLTAVRHATVVYRTFFAVAWHQRRSQGGC